jgi:hypothetical protein
MVRPFLLKKSNSALEIPWNKGTMKRPSDRLMQVGTSMENSFSPLILRDSR